MRWRPWLAPLIAFLLTFGLIMVLAFQVKAEELENPYSVITMTEEEAYELELILAMEAQGEPFDGQMAVVEVIFNRVISPEWPDTVHEVLSQKKQFSTWRYIDHPYNLPEEEQCDAIAEVLTAGPKVLPDTRYCFFSTKKHKWATDYVKIGAHWFGR